MAITGMLFSFAHSLMPRDMAVTLAVYVGVAALTWFYLRNQYPVSTFWPMQLFEAGWLLALSAALIAGTIWLVRRYAA